MLELEKKHVKAYLKDKFSVHKYNKAIDSTEIKFYKVFNYIRNEYYKDLKKEFTDSDIIKKCDISNAILEEIKDFLNKKSLATIKENKIIINYNSVIFFNNMIHDYKNYYMIGVINILSFFLAAQSLLVTIYSNVIENKNTISIVNFLGITGLLIFLFLLNKVRKYKIDKISQYEI